MLTQTLVQFVHCLVPLTPREMFCYGMIDWELWLELEENILPSLSKKDQKQFLTSLTQKLYARRSA